MSFLFSSNYTNYMQELNTEKTELEAWVSSPDLAFPSLSPLYLVEGLPLQRSHCEGLKCGRSSLPPWDPSGRETAIRSLKD